jgi:hypothetical protein
VQAEVLHAILSWTLIDAVEDIERSHRGGGLDVAVRPPHPDALYLSRRLYMMTPERAVWFQKRLRALLDEAMQESDLDEGSKQDYSLALVFYPTLYVEGETVDSTANI